MFVRVNSTKSNYSVFPVPPEPRYSVFIGEKSNYSVFPVPQNLGTIRLLGLMAQNHITVCFLYPRTSVQCVC
jgi:predicted CoA-binding protein